MKALEISDLRLAVLDPASPVPLYHQIEQDLREQIRSGQISGQSVLPPELELGRAYGVGRHTIRTALARLADDGLITRRAGLGTVVKPQPSRTRFYLDRSFTQQMAEMGRVARARVLQKETGLIDKNSPPVFAGELGAPCLRLVRLRLGDDEPIGLQASTILTAQCPDLPDFDFNQNSLYDILARHCHLLISQIEHAIGAEVANEQQAELLQIRPGGPLLVINTTALLDTGPAIEFTVSHYRADRYEYSTTHTY